MLSLVLFIAVHLSPAVLPNEAVQAPEEAPAEVTPTPARQRRNARKAHETGLSAARTGMLVAAGASAVMGVVVGLAVVIFSVAAFLPALAIGGVYQALLASGGVAAAGAPLVLLAPMILPIVAVVSVLALSAPLQLTASMAGWAVASLAHGWRSPLLQTVVPSVAVVAVPAALLGTLASGAALGGVLVGMQSLGASTVLFGPMLAAMFLFPVAAVFTLVAPLMMLTTQGLAAIVLGMSLGARGRVTRPDESAVNMDAFSVPD